MLTIEVTQEDIDTGTPEECKDCPVALAAWRVAEPLGYDHVMVSEGEIAFYYPGPCGTEGIQFRLLPISVSAFINRFDAYPKAPEDPFSFEIEDLPHCKPS